MLLLGLPHGSAGDVRGAALALAAALCYAGYLLLMRAARRGTETLPLLLLTSTSATATLGLAAALRGDAFAGFPAHAWASMLGAAVLSQLGGQMGVIWSLRYLPATVTSVALLAQPVGTALLGWWLLGREHHGNRGARRRDGARGDRARFALGARATASARSERASLACDSRRTARYSNFLGFHQGKKPGMSLDTFIVKRAGRFSRKLVTPS